MADVARPDSISLTAGGPFFRLLTNLHLRTPTSMRRSWWLAVGVWLPLSIGAGVEQALGGADDPMVLDLSLHVRLLVALPIMLSSELLLEGGTRSAIASMYAGNYLAARRLDDIVRASKRLRDSNRMELVMLALAVIGGQLALWRVFGNAGLFHGSDELGAWSFARVWYGLVALPVFQFVMFRWLWRWLIWNHVLWALSRERLTLIATHADLAAGLAALARPTSAFSAFTFAIASILSAAWIQQVILGHTSVAALLPMILVFLAGAQIVAVAPLLLFCPHLYRARRDTLRRYDDFMRWYVVRFQERWIDGDPTAARALGTSDIQSLADLGNAYGFAAKTRLFVFGKRSVLVLWLAGVLPMVPLLLTTVTVEEMLRRIVTTALGGLPL